MHFKKGKLKLVVDKLKWVVMKRHLYLPLTIWKCASFVIRKNYSYISYRYKNYKSRICYEKFS